MISKTTIGDEKNSRCYTSAFLTLCIDVTADSNNSGPTFARKVLAIRALALLMGRSSARPAVVALTVHSRPSVFAWLRSTSCFSHKLSISRVAVGLAIPRMSAT